MTTANWKTNEVLISSLGSGVCACTCSRERDRGRGRPCQVLMLITKQKLANYTKKKKSSITHTQHFKSDKISFTLLYKK